MPDLKVSAFPAATLPLNDTDIILVVQGGVTKRINKVDLVQIDASKTLTATQANATVTPAAATTLTTAVSVGTYLVKVWVVYQAAALTTGIEMFLRMGTGTATRCAATWYTLTTTSLGAGTVTGSQGGVADQATASGTPSTTAVQQIMEGRGQRAAGVASGSTTGVDTINADQFAVLEGIVTVSVAGNLEFAFRSEVAGSAVTLQIGTTLTLQKVI